MKSTDLMTSINLTDDVPVNERPRRFPLRKHKIMEEQVQLCLKGGIAGPNYIECVTAVILCKKPVIAVML